MVLTQKNWNRRAFLEPPANQHSQSSLIWVKLGWIGWMKNCPQDLIKISKPALSALIFYAQYFVYFFLVWYNILHWSSFFFSAENISSKQVEVTNTPPATTPQPVIIQKSPSKNSKLDVDNFVPETDAIENFLDEQDSSTADRLAVLDIDGEKERSFKFFIAYSRLLMFIWFLN